MKYLFISFFAFTASLVQADDLALISSLSKKAAIADFQRSPIFETNLYDKSLFKEKKDQKGLFRLDHDTVYHAHSHRESSDELLRPFKKDDLLGLRVSRRKVSALYKGGQFIEVEIYALTKFGTPKRVLETYNLDSLDITFDNNKVESIQSDDGQFVMTRKRMLIKGISGAGVAHSPDRKVEYFNVMYTDKDKNVFLGDHGYKVE